MAEKPSEETAGAPEAAPEVQRPAAAEDAPAERAVERPDKCVHERMDERVDPWTGAQESESTERDSDTKRRWPLVLWAMVGVAVLMIMSIAAPQPNAWEVAITV